MLKFLKEWWLRKNLSLLYSDLDNLKDLKAEGIREGFWLQGDLKLLDLDIEKVEIEITIIEHKLFVLEQENS